MHRYDIQPRGFYFHYSSHCLPRRRGNQRGWIRTVIPKILPLPPSKGGQRDAKVLIVWIPMEIENSPFPISPCPFPIPHSSNKKRPTVAYNKSLLMLGLSPLPIVIGSSVALRIIFLRQHIRQLRSCQFSWKQTCLG